jgi:hypothetical protein
MEICLIPLLDLFFLVMGIKLCLFGIMMASSAKSPTLVPRTISPYRDATSDRVDQLEAQCRSLLEENKLLRLENSYRSLKPRRDAPGAFTLFRAWLAFAAISIGTIMFGALLLEPERSSPPSSIPPDGWITDSALPHDAFVSSSLKRPYLVLVYAPGIRTRHQRRWCCIGF